MKVLNLQCAHQHSFEGWFASEDAFQSQFAQGLVECPMCGDRQVQKLPTAPRLNLGVQSLSGISSDLTVQEPGSDPIGTTQPGEDNASGQLSAMRMPPGSGTAEQAAFLKALRHLMANTEDVGQRFADEARRMHYGDIESRNIRGQTSAREAMELLDEGIEVMPLPLPAALKETLQ